MEIKHIYWFAYFNLDEPSVRYRAAFPLESLQEKHGITFSFIYPAYNFYTIAKFIGIVLSILFFRKRNSLIVFQKIYSNGIYATALKLLLFFRPAYTLYDIDDAEHTRRPTNTIHYFMKKCSACSAGSNSLVDYIKQFNQNVFLLTSPVIDHGFVKKQCATPITIGWVGYYGAHRQSLTELFFPALYRVDFPVKLKVLGIANQTEEQEIKSYFKNNKNILIEAPLNLNWLDEKSIYETITTFDIGISPLINNEFNRAKSAFKLKKYLSCGVPALGSNVGENPTFLHNQVNGYLCNTPDEYFQKLYLLKDTLNERYEEMSMNARKTFHAFSIDHYCSEFINYFKHQKQHTPH